MDFTRRGGVQRLAQGFSPGLLEPGMRSVCPPQLWESTPRRRKVQIGEGARPRALRERATTPKVYFHPRSSTRPRLRMDREDPTSPTLARTTCRRKAMSDRQRSLPSTATRLPD
jgi:hypothetical protein